MVRDDLAGWLQRLVPDDALGHRSFPRQAPGRSAYRQHSKAMYVLEK